MYNLLLLTYFYLEVREESADRVGKEIETKRQTFSFPQSHKDVVVVKK